MSTKFDMAKFKADAKEIAKAEGKENLMEFAEENAKTLWAIIKKGAEQVPVAFMIVSAADSVVQGLLENINKEDNV